jgi:hypothetical protein
MRTYVHLWSYLAELFLEWEMFETRVVQKIKTHILCFQWFLFFENRSVYEMQKKYCLARQATDDNMAHAGWGQRHALKLCNTYCFSTAKIVTRKPLNVMLYVHYLSSFNFFYLRHRKFFISFYKILLYQPSANFSGWFRLKDEPRKTCTKSVFYEFRFGGVCSLAAPPPPPFGAPLLSSTDTSDW